MAGKPKKRIDYAGWSVDMFTNDTKIDKLLDAQGWDGFGVYFYLCQTCIFGGEGYFYEWCYDLCATIARKMGGGIGAGTVKETVDYCLHIGLFDKGLYDRWGVLTSRGVQKSYLVVLKSKNRQGTEIYSEYWLLDKKSKDYQGVVFVSKNSEDMPVNSHSLEVNGYLLGENDHSLAQEDSKVKDSKEDIKPNVDTHASPKSATIKFTEDSFEIRCVDMLIKSCLELYPNSKVATTLDGKQGWAVEIDRMRRIDGRCEAEIMQALEFAVKDSFWKSNIRSTKKLREHFEKLIIKCGKAVTAAANNKYANFNQREYDYGELEKKLLGVRK